MSEDFSEPGFWSCAKDAPMGHLARALGVPETFFVELSAHDWDDEQRVFDELARAFSFPDTFGRNWEAASDCMSDVYGSRPRFVAVIRDIPESEAARVNVGRAAATIGTEHPEERRQCLVLDGWKQPGIEIDWVNETRVVPVRPLKTS